MKKVAITGLNGVIGQNLIKNIDDEYKIINLYHSNKTIDGKVISSKKLDLSQPKNIKTELKKIKPDIIVHLAAVTHIDKCESDKKNGKKGEVWRVNVDSVKEITDYCKNNNCFLLFLSTECVFDGTKKRFLENDKKNPINWYGYTKNVAEEYILDNLNNFSILRSVVAYSLDQNQNTIYRTFIRKLKNGGKIEVAGDVRFTPTHVVDIVMGIKKLLKNEFNGVFHIAPEEILSPYKFAYLVAKANDLDTKLVHRGRIEDIYGRDKSSLRLKNSCLDAKKSSKVLGFDAKKPSELL